MRITFEATPVNCGAICLAYLRAKHICNSALSPGALHDAHGEVGMAAKGMP